MAVTRDEIRAATAQRKRMAEDAGYAHEKWRRLVVQAMEEGMSTVDIAADAGISRTRLYQILAAMR